MTISHVYLIVNPNAGSGRVGKRMPGILSSLQGAGIRYDVLFTEAPGHATELVRSLNGQAGIIVAVGGDGTVNEVVNGMAHPESVLGVLPTGTGNDFARLIGARTIPDAIGAIGRGNVEIFDCATLRITNQDQRTVEHAFVNTMGVGFDAAVAVRVSRFSLGKGIIPYLIAVLSTLRHYRAVPATVSWGNTTLRTELFLSTIGNGTTSGGGFVLTPDARPDDGELDLCLVQAVGILRVLRILPKTFHGGHLKEKEVVTARSASFTIELAEPLPIHADGEIVSRDAVRIEVGVRPNSLRVVTNR